MISAFVIFTLFGAPQPFAEKQIRVEPKGCHLPSLKGEYPVDGEWRKVVIRIICKR